MSEAVSKSNRSTNADVLPRLFVLELNAGRIHSMNTDGSLPNKTVAGLREDIDSDKLDLLRDFSVAAREKLLRLQY